ncbi:protein YgfX [Halomonas sp. NO4]|uniref:protein YgfX n=1 Tax=Halomonas sp. NO4 TaxID=2484813 RepID=UPI0013D25445|nr:protein YgfX [Halomonas sp. NO4]
MPRTPITIRVVPSRLARASHALIALAVMALLVAYAHPGLWLLGGVTLGSVLISQYRRERGGELRGQPGEAGGAWYWRAQGEAVFRPVTLRCHYLGSWLIGLRLGRESLWLWPDSSERESLRQLRRRLIQLAI